MTRRYSQQRLEVVVTIAALALGVLLGGVAVAAVRQARDSSPAQVASPELTAPSEAPSRLTPGTGPTDDPSGTTSSGTDRLAVERSDPALTTTTTTEPVVTTTEPASGDADDPPVPTTDDPAPPRVSARIERGTPAPEEPIVEPLPPTSEPGATTAPSPTGPPSIEGVPDPSAPDPASPADDPAADLEPTEPSVEPLERGSRVEVHSTQRVDTGPRADGADDAD